MNLNITYLQELSKLIYSNDKTDANHLTRCFQEFQYEENNNLETK